MRSEPSLARSRTRGQRTATGPMPVTISRSGRCPLRTSRWRPSSVSLSAWQLIKAATSASTACASSALAPLRSTSVSGSANVPGWESWKTLVSVTAYHSFDGEVGASNTPTIRRLTPSCRPHISWIAPTMMRLLTDPDLLVLEAISLVLLLLAARQKERRFAFVLAALGLAVGLGAALTIWRLHAT